jgi:uncharacterized repeat protein (TIGR01451 family)
VWQDFDGDSFRDATDVGIGGVTVQLRNSTDTADVATTTTAPDGTYRFVGIVNGSYRIRVNGSTLPAGVTWTQTAEVSPTGTPADGSLDNLISTGGAIGASGGDVRGAYEFGYHRSGTSSIGDDVFYDLDGDGVKGFTEPGIGNVTVRLYEDLSATGVLEAGFDALVATTITSANGLYNFGNLAAGRYIVVVDETDAQFPSNVIATSANPAAVTLPAATALTDVDFGYRSGPGYVEPATIGDFVYYDANGNGEQDFNELGIGGVVLRLYSDTNGNLQFDAGDIDYGTVTTSSGGAGNPPAGFYQFTGLDPDSNPLLPGNNPYIVQVVSIPAGAGTTLADQTADPNRDGVAASDNSFPGLPAADNQDTGKFIDLNGNNTQDPGETGIFVNTGIAYAGADFGYQPAGVVGDYVWLDLNGNGTQDGGEFGLSNVAVSITNVPFGGSTTLNTTTDIDGMYFFQGLTAGTWRITVSPGASLILSTRVDASLLAGFGTVGNNTADLTIDAAGNVTAIKINGQTLNFDAPNDDDGLKIDFGYRFNGANALAGHVVLEQKNATDGNAGEATDTPVAGATMFLYNGTGQLLGSALTDAAGNYSFSGLPNGTYFVSMAANRPILALTTLTTDDFAPGSLPSGATVTDNGTAAYAQINLIGSVGDLDFAWVSTVDYDFGDLPDSYGTGLASDGARHIISGTPTLYLGSAPPDTEGNATPGAAATGDDTTGVDDEDGVTVLNPTGWTDGPTSGTTNTLQVTVNGDGWLVAWIDFNRDGTFLAANELVISQAVSTGAQNYSITIPAGTFIAGGAILNARFRLFSEQPLIPQLTFTGIATGGEVEDYSLVVGVPTLADLELTKTVDNPTPQVGEDVVFTVTVTNTGPSGATGVTVRDLLPNGLQYVGDDSGGDYDSTTGIWTVGALAGSTSAAFHITATVLATGDYTNCAQVQTSDTLDPDSFVGDNSTDQDDDSVTLAPSTAADLSLTKTVDVSNPRVGTNVVFTITVHNSGPSSASGVTVSDVLPNGFQYVSDDSGGNYDTTSGTWTVGSLPNGSDAVLKITATVLATGNYTNAAEIETSDTPDPNSIPGDGSTTDDDDDSVTLNPVPVADLSLTKIVDDSTPRVGDQVVFTLTVSNAGPSAATGVTVEDVLPGGLQYASDDSGSSYSGGVWVIGDIASGDSAVLHITATVLAAGSYTNSAQVQTSDVLDPNSTPGDDSTADDDDDSVTLTPTPVADLSLTKTVDVSSPLVGGNVVFTITVTNAGPSTATGVTVRDLLPNGLQYVSDDSGTAYDSMSGDWSVGSLASGAGAVIHITATVLPTGTYTNSAQVQASGVLDPNSTPGNNSTTEDDDDSVTLTPSLPTTASLAGSVYNDLNGNGQRDGNESGIAGVTVTLTGTDVAGNSVNLTATTDPNGDYSFTSLAAGTYTLTEAQPAPYADGQDRVGTANGTLGNDQVSGVALTAGQVATGYTFGERAPNSIAGFVYRDFNLDGVRTTGGAHPDTGVVGITLTLTGTDVLSNAVTRTTQTDATGAYIFDNLLAGTYTVTETQPPLPTTLTNGFYDGADNVGTPAGTSPAKNQSRVTLLGDATALAIAAAGYNFGELPPADPFGYVYIDANGNGRRDAGEAGIANVAVTISGTAFFGTPFARPLRASDVPGGSLTVHTNAAGLYEFNPIPPGLYSVREAQPTGFADGLEQNADPNPNPAFPVAVGNDVFANVYLAPLPVRGPFNFGERVVPVVPMPTPGTMTMPVSMVNKNWFLSSTAAPQLPLLPSGPTFLNSLAGLGIPAATPTRYVATGADAGQPGIVRVFDFTTGAERFRFEPYAGFMGGVRVAVGDVNADGFEDIVTAAGPGAGPHVKVFDGRSGAVLASFFAYSPAYLGGVSVAAGTWTATGAPKSSPAVAPGSPRT